MPVTDAQRDAIATFEDAVQHDDHYYTGSLRLALAGSDVTPNDIDIVVPRDRYGAFVSFIEEASAYRYQEERAMDGRDDGQRLLVFTVDGVLFEARTDSYYRDAGLDVATEPATVNGTDIDIVTLDTLVAIYAWEGRGERLRQARDALDR